MAFQSTNPDLSLGMVRPGVYVAVNLDAPGGGVDDISKRMLILAYKESSGTAPLNKPFLCVSDQDAINGCGRKSDARRGFAQAITQVGAGNIDIYILPLDPPSGGTASTYLLECIAAANALAPGSIDLTIDGQSMLSVPFATGDTPTTIMAAVNTAIANMQNIPCSGGVSTITETMTYIHKGLVGEDMPIRAKVNGTGTGISLRAGTLTFATNVTGAGSVTITIAGVTITVAIANADTPAQVVTKCVTAINAADYPVTAAVNASSTAVLDLYYAPDRDVRRITAAIVTSTGITVTPAVGTAGAGAPTLTTAITNLGALAGFAQWAHPFVGSQAAPDSTSGGTIATFVETMANGLNQQEQRVHFGTPWPASSQGGIVTGTSPALTSSPRYAGIWCQDAGNQGWGLACRLAALRAANDYPAQNYDGMALKGSVQWPLILPAQSSRPDGGTINSAMRSYYLTPLRVNESDNTLVIEKATTTSNASYQPLRDFATIDQIAFWRRSLAARLYDRFHGASAKQVGIPRTPRTITAQAVADEAYLLALEWEAQDLYDGAEAFKAGFKSSFNASNPTRIDLVFPMSPVINVHQIGAVGNLTSPSQA